MLKLFKAKQGFTLIEMIVGIVVLAIAMGVITAALGPLYKKSADPWHQVRAAELGHSLLNEIMARSFDENSDRSGSGYRCDAASEAGAIPCTTPVLTSGQYRFPKDAVGCVGANCESRESFDDVDDFDGFNSDGGSLVNIVDAELLQRYRNYQARVWVIYDGNYDGVTDNCAFIAVSPPCDERKAKLITVVITTPGGEDIAFSAYKGNW